MYRIAVLSLLVSVSTLAAPPEIPNKKVSFEFKELGAKNLLGILGEIGHFTVVVSDEFEAVNVTMRLQNVPLSVAFDTVLSRLDATAVVRDGEVFVFRSQPGAQQVTLEARSEPAATVLEALARQAGLAGSMCDGEACRQPLTVTLPPVTLSTALAVLRDATRLNVRVSGDRLVAQPFAVRSTNDAGKALPRGP